MSDEVTSPFIRYRHGTPLVISNDIDNALSQFISKYEGDSEKALRDLIQDIADGSGAGIHPEATWYQALRELFATVRDLKPAEKQKVESCIVDLVGLIIENKSITKTWKKVVSFYKQNYSTLSGWEFSHLRRFSNDHNYYRDEDGEVYYDEGDSLVHVLDGKTRAETLFEYLSGSIQNNYSLTGAVIRLIQLVFISRDFKTRKTKTAYDQAQFVMNEDGHNTWFLHGMWRFISSKNLRVTKWYPPNLFCSLDWLQSDLVRIAAEIADDPTRNMMMGVADKYNGYTKWMAAFEDFTMQYEVALETDVFISEEGEVPQDIYFAFEGRRLRWMNGSVYNFPSLIIPTNDQSYDDAREIARKFLSLLIFENSHIRIREYTSAAKPKGYNPLLVQPRLPSVNEIDSRWFDSSQIKRSKQLWHALAFYKEAKNSESLFYKFLNYYKIVLMKFVQAQDNREDVAGCSTWITSEFEKLSESELVVRIKSEADSKSSSVGEYVTFMGRDAASHVGDIHKLGQTPTIHPDNQSDRLRYIDLISIIEPMARKVIEDMS